jgi:predicted phosphodiesterase
MARMRQTRHPEFSLWQSAIDQTLAQNKGGQTEDVGGGGAVQRPDPDDPMVAASAMIAVDIENKRTPSADVPADEAAARTEDVGGAVKYCSTIWWEIAKARVRGDTAAEQAWQARLGKFTSCDPRYSEAVEQYVEFYKVKCGKVPYRVWKNIGDFVIDGQLPANAKVAIVGDWGTGQQDAKALLAAIARKNPDVVIHLGDVYYSGTEFEMENYFYNIWNSELDLTKTKTFALTGNHDMYSGGGPYYELIDKLGQPASYFCLRNDDWQFIGLDTGLHDDDPLGAAPTYLEATEVQWLQDKINTAGRRKTVLLSHHQLFTAYEDIGSGYLNPNLSRQVGPMLGKVTAWLWGHEHNQVIYKPFQGVLGRCVGHGAYPVGIAEIPAPAKHPEVPLENVQLAKGASFYAHGYVMVELSGAPAKVSYYQDSDPEDVAMFTETWGAAAGSAGSVA